MLTSPRRFERQASALAGVDDGAWDCFTRALCVQPINAISASGGFGCWDLRPRRLGELGVMTDLRYVAGPGRDRWEGDFVSPWSADVLLGDVIAQHGLFVASMRLYAAALADGRIVRPVEVSRAGALAILHRGGRGALASWPRLFDDTRAIFDAAKGLF